MYAITYARNRWEHHAEAGHGEERRYAPAAVAAASFPTPDVLVLGAGGVLGEAWMTGLLAGIEYAAEVDFRRCERFLGTSAGSIVAAHLASGRSPRTPGHVGEPEAPSEAAPASAFARAARRGTRLAGVLTGAAATPLAPLVLAAGAPGAALARGAVLGRLPRPRTRLGGVRTRVDRSGVRFDGRLRIAVVDRARGRRVMLGAPGAPRASVGEAVEASCAVPWIFAPVEIDGREYVDGGAWSVTNLDAAPVSARTQVLCLNPIASTGSARSPFGALRAATRVATGVEALALRRRGASVRVVGPDPSCSAIMGADLMRPERGEEVLGAAFRQGQALGASAAENPKGS